MMSLKYQRCSGISRPDSKYSKLGHHWLLSVVKEQKADDKMTSDRDKAPQWHVDRRVLQLSAIDHLLNRCSVLIVFILHPFDYK